MGKAWRPDAEVKEILFHPKGESGKKIEEGFSTTRVEAAMTRWESAGVRVGVRERPGERPRVSGWASTGVRVRVRGCPGGRPGASPRVSGCESAGVRVRVRGCPGGRPGASPRVSGFESAGGQVRVRGCLGGSPRVSGWESAGVRVRVRGCPGENPEEVRVGVRGCPGASREGVRVGVRRESASVWVRVLGWPGGRPRVSGCEKKAKKTREARRATKMVLVLFGLLVIDRPVCLIHLLVFRHCRGPSRFPRLFGLLFDFKCLVEKGHDNGENW
eukprot:1177473-Prorocentrum_minimum.AAC.2